MLTKWKHGEAGPVAFDGEKLHHDTLCLHRWPYGYRSLLNFLATVYTSIYIFIMPVPSTRREAAHCPA